MILLQCSRHIRNQGAQTPLISSLVTHGRTLLTLAIESSCDDTSVAILEKKDGSNADDWRWKGEAHLHFHEKVTADNTSYGGVHPIISLESHQKSLALLVCKALKHLPIIPAPRDRNSEINICFVKEESGRTTCRRKPDFISVTRGPGMRSCLAVGLDTAKGLALAYQVPLLGIHHMQAHALTPRLVTALEYLPHTSPSDSCSPADPALPFLSLLVSGGHTLLIHSKGLTDHEVLASTSDIAIGDAIDKIARFVVPPQVLQTSQDTMYGRILEEFAFPNGSADYDYTAPANRAEELETKTTTWGWGFAPPLARSKSGSRSKAMEYSFSGLCSAAKRFMEFCIGSDGTSSKTPRDPSDVSTAERRAMAHEAQRVLFEHLASRIVLYLKSCEDSDTTSQDAPANLETLVVAGGVASNLYLRTVLRSFLNVRGFSHIRLLFPPPALCTDNAAMIAWAGIEMFEAGWESDLGIIPLRKWSLDTCSEDGGILGVKGWRRSTEKHPGTAQQSLRGDSKRTRS